VHRRTFLRAAAALGGAALVRGADVEGAMAMPARPGAGPYGPCAPGGVGGVACPTGFTSRVVARAGEAVAGGQTWHPLPDGGATFAGDDGWVYVSNSEVPGRPAGGAGAVRFDRDGEVVDAYRILGGTTMNCAGGATPWGTWLSCEEVEHGLVHECDPWGPGQGEPLPALGAFAHEAAAVDPGDRVLYMTEDDPRGRLYRFVPDAYPSLARGTLQVARVDRDGLVDWLDIADPSGRSAPTREQRREATVFDGGEGICRDGRWLYISTKGDDRIWAFDLDAQRILPLYDSDGLDDPPLFGVDNVAVSASGDVYVAEDGGRLRISVIAADTLEVAPVVELHGDEHDGSEITGLAFSPDGTRLCFSSQRAGGIGVTYEVAGPFRTARAGVAGDAARTQVSRGLVVASGTTARSGVAVESVASTLSVSALALTLAVAARRPRVAADAALR
jgi:hypothetical protein